MVAIRKIGHSPEFGPRAAQPTVRPIEMEFLDSVAPEEVPKAARRAAREGIWTGLVKRTIADHEAGRVTVIKLPNQDEVKRMRNGTGDAFRKQGYFLRAVLLEEADGVRVFMKLRQKEGA